MHACGGEQDRRIERRRDQRGRRHAPVAALLEERQERLADLVGSHPTIVAHPTTTSPRSRQAIWPGATPWTGSASAIVSPSSRHRTAGERERSFTAPTASAPACSRTPRTRTVVVASAARGPTVTVFARASVRSTYSGSSS